MSKLQKLFKHTLIYGLATILPRVISLILTPLYVNQLKSTTDFGVYSGLFVYLILGNVLLSYGMETAFFRFLNKKEENKNKVQSTALTSLFFSSLLFFLIAFPLRHSIAEWLEYDVNLIGFCILILFLDALVVIPFAQLRNAGKSLTYAVIKIGNVTVNLLLNLFFFLGLPKLNENPFWSFLQIENQVYYIFIANTIASLLTFIVLLPIYFQIRFGFSFALWKQMLRYAFPILIAGIAFAVNEGFDRVFLRMLLPFETADATIGIYSACYKMGVFMTLFVTAYKLGVEPFFFSNAQSENAPQTYALITEYFTIFGAFILLFITVFTDFFKLILINNSAYWEALWIVPIILLANLCLGVYHSLSVWYKVTDRTHVGAYISIFGMFITVSLNFLLIPILSYKGSALATLATYLVMMLTSYFIGQRKYPIPYNVKKISFYLGFSILASFLSFYVFDRNMYIGIFLLLLYIFIVFQKETVIKKRLKSILTKR
ncbi:oligosaccharide flippase family protein [Capnocytophaga felis]|uniref:Polysaccharide biosynthesis protein n=1 Tax=Capnocytophaga felis TaxID=2267611 RepID=A0A5M4BAC1_9FLAO|nr:oligosaccharide flippase family protein [Capnocytophaga felis]GET46551.1 polysaccharide biosynthesis protein [Capnocytophaga felis]GET49025.1 polysaccharide biosynthesis protein [Capnocytophaga felis]